jgi:hypothetical protein
MKIGYNVKKDIHMIIDLETGKEFSPKIFKLSQRVLKHLGVFDSLDWKMDWNEPFVNDCKVYGMFTDLLLMRIEGLVAFVPEEGSLLMYQLETASHNQYGSHKRVYKGVGKHLTAFGCQLSKEMYQETYGSLSAYSKSEARPFYESLNAREAFSDNWYFSTVLGQSLIDECL